MNEMLALAASRRSGQHPVYTSTWGVAIGTLQDLKTLELILETFSVKQHQLDTVVECAKTWKFLLQDTQYELAYDGRVESMKWAKPTNGDGGRASDGEPRKEDMTPNEDDSSSNDEREGPNVQGEASHRTQEALHDDQEAEDISNQDEALDESEDEHESFSPIQFSDIEDDEDDYYDGTSPVYDWSDYADDWDAFPDESWMRTPHEFEVRVVRFRRRRAD